MPLETIDFGVKNPAIVVEAKEDLHKYSVVRVRGVQHTKVLSGRIKLTTAHILPSAIFLIDF